MLLVHTPAFLNGILQEIHEIIWNSSLFYDSMEVSEIKAVLHI